MSGDGDRGTAAPPVWVVDLLDLNAIPVPGCGCSSVDDCLRYVVGLHQELVRERAELERQLSSAASERQRLVVAGRRAEDAREAKERQLVAAQTKSRAQFRQEQGQRDSEKEETHRSTLSLRMQCERLQSQLRLRETEVEGLQQRLRTAQQRGVGAPPLINLPCGPVSRPPSARAKWDTASAAKRDEISLREASLESLKALIASLQRENAALRKAKQSSPSPPLSGR